MSLKSLSRWYPNFKPSVSRSAGADDDIAMLLKGRLLPCMESGDCGEARKQMPVQSMCLNVVLSCEVGSAGNTMRSSLLAAVGAVQEHARSCGVSIIVDDAGAGLRKAAQPGYAARASQVVDTAAVVSGSSFFISAILNEYGEFVLPGTIPFHTFVEIGDFASAHPLLHQAKPLLLESLDRAYARDCTGGLVLRRVLPPSEDDEDNDDSSLAKALATVFNNALASLIIVAFIPVEDATHDPVRQSSIRALLKSRMHHEHERFFQIAGTALFEYLDAFKQNGNTIAIACSRDDLLVVMPGKQMPSKPPPSHGFNRPYEKNFLAAAASPFDALGLLMQNHDFAFSVKSHTHTCTAQLTADVIRHMTASVAEQPMSPMRRNSQASRSSTARSPLRSSMRTSASVLPPPPAASFSSYVEDAPSPSKSPTTRLSPPPSRSGKTAARSPSPSSRVSFAAAASVRTRRSSSAAEPAASGSSPSSPSIKSLPEAVSLLSLEAQQQEEWDAVLQRMCNQPGNLVCVLRQQDPEKLAVDLAAALKQRIECLFMQRMKLPMANTLLNSVMVWKRCMALQPPILLNKTRLCDIALGVVTLIDVAAGGKNEETTDTHPTHLLSTAASTSSLATMSLPSSPIKFIIMGGPGDGKTVSIAILSLFLQDHFKHSNMSSSIIIPTFPSSSSTVPHACDILKSINHQLRERLPNSFRRPEPPHSSLRNLRHNFTYYTSMLLEMSSDAIIVIVIDDLHLFSHSIACVEQPSLGYFLPSDLNSRVIIVAACDPSHVPWLQSQSLAPPSPCIIGLHEGAGSGDCRVSIISTFAARHLKRLTEAEGLVMQAMASNETKAEYIRDVQHFRSVFAAAADEQARYSAIHERIITSLPLHASTSIKKAMSGAAFLKWLGSDGDLPEKGSDNALFFSHASTTYVRGCCAALESLSPPNDVRTVTIVKRMLDAGLADVCLVDSVNLRNCVLAVLGAACRNVSKYIVARVVALVSCAPLCSQELGDVLTLDGGAVSELDASVSAYSIKQFPVRVVDDVLGYLALIGVERMENDTGGVMVTPPHIKLLLLQWAASQGFTELDGHAAIASYFLRDEEPRACGDSDASAVRSPVVVTRQPLLYHLTGLEAVDDSGDRAIACNQRRLVIGCTSAIICGDIVGAVNNIMNSRLLLNAFEQGLGYFLINALAALLMIQNASQTLSAPSSDDSASFPVLLPPNTSLAIFSTWQRLHSSSSTHAATRRLSDEKWIAAKQYAVIQKLLSTKCNTLSMYFAFLNAHFVTLCEQPSKMTTLALTLASSAGNAVFDDVLHSLSQSSRSFTPFVHPRWSSKCLSVHVPSFDAVSSLRTTVVSSMNHPAVRFRLSASNSSSYFLADSEGLGIRVMMKPPHKRVVFPAIPCSRVVALDFDSFSSSLYIIVIKETPRGGSFTRQLRPDAIRAAASNANRERTSTHPSDFLFKSRSKHTRPDTGDCAEGFAGFATLDTTLQLLRCSEGNEPEVILVSAAAGNMVHSLVLSHEQPGGGVTIVFGAKQQTPEHVQECRRLGVITFASTIPLAHDDNGSIIATTAPLRVTLHTRGEGVASSHWSKANLALTHNAQCCSMSPDGRALAVLLSNCTIVLFLRSAAATNWVMRGSCMPRPSVSLRAVAVTRISGSVAAVAGGNDVDDVLVAVSSAQGIVQVWHFATSSSAAASASTTLSSETSARHSPPRRSNMSQLESAAAAHADGPMSSCLTGLHCVGACAARDEIPLAFVRTAARNGDEECGLWIVAADASGTVRTFDVQASIGANQGVSESVVMISSRGDRKQERIMPAVGHAASVVAFQMLSPCSLATLDATGTIMMHCARSSALTASSDGCDITRVDCFIMKPSVAIGSALPLTHAMNFSQRESHMFTGSSDGSLSAFDRDFVCYWQTRVCECSISCLAFSSNALLHIGCDNGMILTFNMNRCAVEWNAMSHSGRVLAIDATDHHTASVGDDGSVILTDKDGIAVYSLRCDAGFCGIKFTRARSLATVTCSGKLQLRAIDSLPPKAAAQVDASWPLRLEVDAETGGRRCTAFDLIEDNVGGGVAVLAIGQVGVDWNNASDVAATIIDLASKIVVARYRGPSSAITCIALATGDWSLLPLAKRRESRGGVKKSTITETSLAEESEGLGMTSTSRVAPSDAEQRLEAAGGVACLSGTNAIIASCNDGTVHMWSPLLRSRPILLSACGIDDHSSSLHLRHHTGAAVEPRGEASSESSSLEAKNLMHISSEKSNV